LPLGLFGGDVLLGHISGCWAGNSVHIGGRISR
jgi:hypothetical protein